MDLDDYSAYDLEIVLPFQQEQLEEKYNVTIST
jgi:hypothetical protein